MVPFNTGKDNLEEIRKVYARLIREKRLYITEHAIREFAKNRSLKVSELYTNIDNLLASTPTIKSFQYPILGKLQAYKKLKDSRENIFFSLKEYKQILSELKSGITSWNWSDPVTSMYSKIFSDEIILKNKLSEGDLVDEYNQRIIDDIP